MDERDTNEDEAAPALPTSRAPFVEAGEFVLGTMDADERARFARRAEVDPRARRAVVFWQERLAPLDEVAAPVSPRANLWDGIRDALPPQPLARRADNDNITSLRRSRNAWRALALLAALVLVAGGVLLAEPDLRGSLERRLGLPPLVSPQASNEPGPAAPVVARGPDYVAVVNSDGKLPAMIVRVDGATGRVFLRPLALAEPEGGALQLWHIPPGAEPRSLGLIGENATIEAVGAQPGDTFAVSEEAPGGSTTGAPSGPPVYSGQLVPEPE